VIDFRTLDRTRLRSTLELFVRAGPGVLAVRGRDPDARHIAADIICDQFDVRHGGNTRIRQIVDEPFRIRSLLLAAWGCLSVESDVTTVGPNLATGAFADLNEIMAGISAGLPRGHKINPTIVFETIDEEGPVPTSALLPISKLAKMSSSNIVVICRTESGSNLPADFQRHDLGGLGIVDLKDTILAWPMTAPIDSALRALVAVEPLACEGVLDADFAYEHFEEQLR
jgi:hypothetical protein